MTPADELAACKQALSQYRRGWRELALTLRRHNCVDWDVVAALARKHGLPVMPPADEMTNKEIKTNVPD